MAAAADDARGPSRTRTRMCTVTVYGRRNGGVLAVLWTSDRRRDSRRGRRPITLAHQTTTATTRSTGVGVQRGTVQSVNQMRARRRSAQHRRQAENRGGKRANARGRARVNATRAYRWLNRRRTRAGAGAIVVLDRRRLLGEGGRRLEGGERRRAEICGRVDGCSRQRRRRAQRFAASRRIGAKNGRHPIYERDCRDRRL